MESNKGPQTTKVLSLVLANNMRTKFLFLLCSLCFFQGCLAADVLNAGQNITGTTSVLISAGKRFVLGFFNPPGSSKESYLGIWYSQEQYPGKQTVVWIANRDNPVVGSSGVFQIASDGNLVVTNTSGVRYWSSKLRASPSRSRTMRLLDSGNLVIIDGQNGTSYIWQSFQHPTDTFLPSMNMDTTLELTSWRDDNDPRSGKFTFKMAQKGSNFYVILYNQQQLHWENDGPNSKALSPDELNYLANFSTMSNSSDQVRTWKSFYLNKQDTRIVMNSTGVMQFLWWDNAQWIMLLQQPSDKCNIYNYCGNFSSCNSNDWMYCKCLPGFRPRTGEINQQYEADSGSPGCARKSPSYDSNKDMMFLNLTNIRMGSPDQTNATDNEAECLSLCLNMSHPMCQAYSYVSTSPYNRDAYGCGIWTQDLTTLQVDQHGGGDLSVLVKSSDIAPTARSCEPCGTYVIPYPLSTGPNCGDPLYYKFNCNYSTGQVIFNMSKAESYRVTWVDENARKFYIQTSDLLHCDANYQVNKPDSPFNVTNWCFKEDEIEVSWLPAPEPPCNQPIDCNDWPHSTCSAPSEGTKKCLCNSNYQWNALNLNCIQGEPSTNHSTNRLPLILSVTLTGMLFLACTIIFALWRNKVASKKTPDKANIQIIQDSLYDKERHVKDMIGLGGLEEKDSEGIDAPFYTFESIIAATDNFSDSNKLGQGGYGPVYKGRFPGGQDIAVKRLSSVSSQGLEEFKNEVVLIAKLQHRNLVGLRGYCIKGDEKILIYEYMPNKSLDSFIFDRTRTLLLDWQIRFDIILGIARGLLYLHQDSKLRVIHRDLKTSNILLDEEMTPKISDFGLAKIFAGKEIEATTQRVVGT